MRELESSIWEQIGFHVEGDLGRVIAMSEKADVWRARGKADKNGESKQKLSGIEFGMNGRARFQNQQKARVGLEKFWECNLGKRDYTSYGRV